MQLSGRTARGHQGGGDRGGSGGPVADDDAQRDVALGTAPRDMDAGVEGDEAGSRCRGSSCRRPGKHRICLAAAPVDEGLLGNGEASDRESLFEGEGPDANYWEHRDIFAQSCVVMNTDLSS